MFSTINIQFYFTFSTIHSNSTDSVFTQVLSNFKNKTSTSVILNFKGIQNGGQVFLFELDIDNGTNNRTIIFILCQRCMHI